jgi:alpha-L-rhamnosidase
MQAWAVLAGLPESQAQGATALRAAYNDNKRLETTTVVALSSHLHHYLCDASIKAGLESLAVQHIRYALYPFLFTI